MVVRELLARGLLRLREVSRAERSDQARRGCPEDLGTVFVALTVLPFSRATVHPPKGRCPFCFSTAGWMNFTRDWTMMMQGG